MVESQDYTEPRVRHSGLKPFTVEVRADPRMMEPLTSCH